MNLKTTEKDLLNDEDQPISLPKKLYLLIRSNWLPILFALIITVITVVAVPIIYSIKKATGLDDNKTLAWTIEGKTVAGKLGITGNDNYLLGKVSSLAIDSYGNIYIVDRSNHRIVRLNVDLSSFTHIAGKTNGTFGNDSSALYLPNDIYIDSLSNIYIADTYNHRIQKWIKDSTQGVTIFGTGSAGSDSTQLRYPMSVTRDINKNTIYIADYGNDRIVQVNLDNKNVTIFLQFYPNIERNTCVRTPISIRFDSLSNTLVIAQEQGFNVIRWNPNSTYWTLIAGSASSELQGTSRTLFKTLCSANIDSLGNTYVADCNNHRIQFYQGDLVKGRTIGGVIEAAGNNTYLLFNPTATILDEKFNLYVADSKNFRIQMFKRT